MPTVDKSSLNLWAPDFDEEYFSNELNRNYNDNDRKNYHLVVGGYPVTYCG